MDVEITVTHWPGLVINRGITFTSRVATPVIYKGPITSFITRRDPPCKSRIGNAPWTIPYIYIYIYMCKDTWTFHAGCLTWFRVYRVSIPAFFFGGVHLDSRVDLRVWQSSCHDDSAVSELLHLYCWSTSLSLNPLIGWHRWYLGFVNVIVDKYKFRYILWDTCFFQSIKVHVRYHIFTYNSVIVIISCKQTITL